MYDYKWIYINKPVCITKGFLSITVYQQSFQQLMDILCTKVFVKIVQKAVDIVVYNNFFLINIK